MDELSKYSSFCGLEKMKKLSSLFLSVDVHNNTKISLILFEFVNKDLKHFF